MIERIPINFDNCDLAGNMFLCGDKAFLIDDEKTEAQIMIDQYNEETARRKALGITSVLPHSGDAGVPVIKPPSGDVSLMYRIDRQSGYAIPNHAPDIKLGVKGVKINIEPLLRGDDGIQTPFRLPSINDGTK